MVPRWLRAAYYGLLSPAMRLNSARHRAIPLVLRHSRRAHLGPGQHNYLDGWINVDANVISAKHDVWADLRFRLPFPSESLDAVYSHHVIEHLPDLDRHFHELFRCLRPGAVLRVGGPHGDNAIKAFVEQDLGWFGDWPTRRSSIGGRFENFIFCKSEHLTILTESFLRELAEGVGFVDFRVATPGKTHYPEYFGNEVMVVEPNDRPDRPNTLLIEARKPMRS
jgi:predicted SAM-dependent methyltransferase